MKKTQITCWILEDIKKGKQSSAICKKNYRSLVLTETTKWKGVPRVHFAPFCLFCFFKKQWARVEVTCRHCYSAAITGAAALCVWRVALQTKRQKNSFILKFFYWELRCNLYFFVVYLLFIRKISQSDSRLSIYYMNKTNNIMVITAIT